jgi:DNA-binding NarL/FixJ family response regulator
MRIRAATESDIEAIAATLDGRNSLPLEPRVRAALPFLLRQLLSSPASGLVVFETGEPAGPRIISVAGGLFLRDSVIEQYLAAPQPGLLSGVLARMLDGRPQLLTLDEIRRANSSDGLLLAVLAIPYGQREWDDPVVVEIRQRAPQGFLRSFGGYRLRAIYYEVFTDEAASYLQAGGYRLLHDFSAQAGRGHLRPDCRPRMLRLTRGDLPPGAMSVATQMFDPLRARLGLTPAEQRVVLRALDGVSDHVIAESLGLSRETVRSSWRSVYRRLETALPELSLPEVTGDSGTRGQERRRAAIEYLRQNMHELRPWSR